MSSAGLLLYADSVHDADIYYVTRFLASDPFMYGACGQREILAVPTFELGRARNESRVGDVRTYDELGYRDHLERTNDRISATAAVMAKLVGELGMDICTVPPTFPLIMADLLRREGLSVEADPSLFVDQRRRKRADEIEAIAEAQARAEAAVMQARDMLVSAQEMGGHLLYDGIPLTAERLKAEIEADLVADGYTVDGLVAAPGPGSANPHWSGSGPILANQPLILDVFPRNRRTLYHGDVTRTYVKGSPAPGLHRMYDAVLRAQEVALALIAPGVNGRDVHDAVVEAFRERGFAEGQPVAQFPHGTGHGLGLQVHELPSLSWVRVELREGDVVTVEPGLYEPDIGGVRIEDVVVVTAAGNRNLNALTKELVVP